MNNLRKNRLTSVIVSPKRLLLLSSPLILVLALFAVTPSVSAVTAKTACKSYKGSEFKACENAFNSLKNNPKTSYVCTGGHRPDPVVRACEAGKKAGKKAGKSGGSSPTKPKTAVDKAQKALDKAEKDAKDICGKKGKKSRQCKDAKRKVEDAKKRHKEAVKRAKATLSGSSSYGSGAATGACNKGFFGLVPWYKYIRGEFKYTESKMTQLNRGSGNCEIKCFNILSSPVANDCGKKSSDIPYVLLAIVDNVLRIAGLVAVAFVLIGSVKYIASQGNPEDTANAQSTIINALIGLAVAIVAVSLISFIGSRIS